MTTFQNDVNPIQSIASFSLYLWPSESEIQFIDGKPNPVMLQGMIDNHLYTPNTRPNQHQNRMPGDPFPPRYLKDAPTVYSSGQLVDFTVRPQGTMLRWLESQGSKFAGFLRWIRHSHLENYLNAQDQSGQNMFTLFAPLDTTELWKATNRAKRPPEDLLRYHLLRQPMLPIEMMRRMLRYPTMMADEVILIDGVSNPPSVRCGESAVNPNIPVHRLNRISQSKQTDNGFVYVIDEALVPSNRY
jgi:hypothetical protein